MFGLLNLDKTAGVTSRDVVNRVQRLVNPHKVGHAGTLDPLATGVLVVAVGAATRLIEYVQRMPKTYRATFLLGRTSNTEDVEGTVTIEIDPVIPTRAHLAGALPKFTGTIEQRPPAFSALKVAGQRAHDLARRGSAVELAPRPIEVHSIEMVRYEYPELELLIRCGSGTYVRSLGRDLAASLGTSAVMSALRRLAIGPFDVNNAAGCELLARDEIERRLLPPDLALSQMPRLSLGEEELARVARGQAIANSDGIGGEEVAALGPDGQLAAILIPAGAGALRPTKCFVAS
jgi:tRNA pseudouridine55 synthase